ncbi:hypothetical protein N0V82_005404 [Gnomoniopsis sp. IMI 355080]|nr:hypothetical protein N0V82_005404 [Gnomoniopsis sp. IMI 355080]
MAPEAPNEGPQDRRDEQTGHQQRKSESRQDEKTPDPAANFHCDQSIGGTRNDIIDLTEDAQDTRDESRKHVPDGESHDPDTSNKRAKLCGDRDERAATFEETTNANPSDHSSPCSSTGTMSDNEVLNSIVDFDSLLELTAKSKQELDEKGRELELERAAHSTAKDIVLFQLSAMGRQHDASQQKLQDDHKQELRELREKAKHDVQSIVSEKIKACEALEIQLQGVRHEKETFARSQVKELLAVRRERDIAKKELIERNAQLEDAQLEIQAAQADQKTIKELYESKRGVNKKLENRNRFLEKRHTSVQENLKASQTELQAQADELQTALESQIEKHNETTNDLLQQLRDSQGLSQRYNFKISDEEIVEKWGDLRHNLCQFVDRYTRPIQLSTQHLDGMWMKLSPIIRELAASPLVSAFALEAYLWTWLDSVVFNLDSLVWSGSLGRDTDYELQAEYHSWRATSSNILSRLSEREYTHELYHAHVHSLAKRLHELLGPNFIQENAFQELVAIFNDARDFEIMRRKLKSCVSIRFDFQYNDAIKRRYDTLVEDALMQKRDPELSKIIPGLEGWPGSTVRLVVSPAIVRWGNSNGADYDRQTCLVKMDVLFSHSSDDLPRLTDQPVLATGDEKSGQPISIDNGNPLSAGTKKEDDTQGERQLVPTTPSQSARLADTTPASTAINTRSRPHRATKGKARQKCYIQQKEEPEENDELSGDPSDFQGTKDTKPPRSKKSISTGDGDGGR